MPTRNEIHNRLNQSTLEVTGKPLRSPAEGGRSGRSSQSADVYLNNVLSRIISQTIRDAGLIWGHKGQVGGGVETNYSPEQVAAILDTLRQEFIVKPIFQANMIAAGISLASIDRAEKLLLDL